MRLLLENKTAVITGAARGIGKAIAKRFAEEGCNIAFTDLNEENIKATEAELQALGVKAKGYLSNAADFADAENTVKQIHEDFGSIDVLVNNAGITRDTLMMRMTEKQWDDVITVNLKSAFNFIHAVVPIMARQRCGSIINMASVVGVSGNAGQANYSASKAGMIGLAKSIAKRFAEEGCNIAFTDLNEENIKATEVELQALGVKVKGYLSNAADFTDVENTVKQIHADFGSIDVLVNNAGITRDTLMMRMTEKQWDDVITVNLKSAFNFIHAVVPIMARQRNGSIINMASVVGVSGNAGQANYSASKAGMIGLAKSIAKEMGSRNIRANCIAPGFIITDMTNQISEEARADWMKIIPLKRGGTPEDVADTALFLASDMSRYVTGQVIHCCGGMNC